MQRAPAQPADWRALCASRCADSALAHNLQHLHHTFATPPPSAGQRRPLQARFLEGQLDPFRGSGDRALASPQTRRIASYHCRPLRRDSCDCRSWLGFSVHSCESAVGATVK